MSSLIFRYRSRKAKVLAIVTAVIMAVGIFGGFGFQSDSEVYAAESGKDNIVTPDASWEAVTAPAEAEAVAEK